MVSLRNIHFGYPGTTFTIRVDALGVDQGGWLAVVGPSGSGKTTLLKIMAGLLRPQGTVEVAGVAVMNLNDKALRTFRLRQIGQVFQNFELIPYLTVRENILLPVKLIEGEGPEEHLEERLESLVAPAGLEPYLQRLPANLSRGEQQRVAICRALLLSPKVILADEPTASLDPASKEGVMDLLLNLCRKEKATVITVTHDMEVADLHDRIVDVSDFSKFREGGIGE